MSETDELPALTDVFRKSMNANDQSMPVAFVAVLDELDRRYGQVESDLVENTERFIALAQWAREISEAQKALPGTVRTAAENGLKRVVPDLEREARRGSREGIEIAKGGVEALRGATERLEVRKAWLGTLAAITLPVALCGALLAGLLMGHYGIRAFPASWEWTCSVIGATHWQNDAGKSYCIIEKQ